MVDQCETMCWAQTLKASDLKRIPLFAALSDSERNAVAAGLEVRHLEPGSVVLDEGQENSFFVLGDGELDVRVHGVRRGTLRSGAFFGEISLAHEVPVTASLIATTPATLYVMGKPQFEALHGNSEALLRLKAAMTDRQAADRLFG
jgi:CRP-like cAMP-binding protein